MYVRLIAIFLVLFVGQGSGDDGGNATSTVVEDVDVANATIGEEVGVVNATIGEEVDMVDSTFGGFGVGDAFIIDLVNAKIDREVDMVDSTIGGFGVGDAFVIDLVNAKIGEEVDMVDSTIGEDDAVINATIGEEVGMNDSTIGEDDAVINSTIDEDAGIVNLTIGEDAGIVNLTIGEDVGNVNSTVDEDEGIDNLTIGEDEEYGNSTTDDDDTTNGNSTDAVVYRLTDAPTVTPEIDFCTESDPLLVGKDFGVSILRVLYGFSNADDLIDASMPQHRAACYLIFDDPNEMEINDPYLIQRYVALVTIYSLFDDIMYDIIKRHSDICEWDEFFTCNEENYIIALDLTAYDLPGILPREVGLLTNLTSINLANTNLQGNIPETIGKLTSVTELYLEGNELTGAFPRSLEDMEALQRLYVMENYLTGDFPLLPRNIIELKMNDNMINGSIVLNDLDKLEELILMNNTIGGTIPPSIGVSTQLKNVNLMDNELTGSIPPSFGNLNDLVTLNLIRNDLSGSLPPKMREFDDLVSLLLQGNSFTGSIPSFGFQGCSLQTVIMENNKFNRNIPSTVSKCKDLETFLINNNRLTGAMPTAFGALSSLRTFMLEENDITGVMPFSNCVDWLSGNNTLSADCGAPQKIKCDCCTNCRDVFTVDYNVTQMCTGNSDAITDEVQLEDSCDAVEICGLSLDGYTKKRVALDTFMQAVEMSEVPSAGTEEHNALCAWFNNYLMKWDETSLITHTFQYYALSMLYVQTGGPNWRNNDGWESFTTNKEFCGWYGVTCDDSQFMVTALNLTYNKMSGSISNSSFIFPGLRELDLSLNGDKFGGYLEGSADFIIRAKELRIVNIRGNRFGGSFPNRIGELSRLQSLLCQNNKMESSIPASFSLLTDLVTVNLANNTLSRNVPDLSRFDKLKYLSLKDNGITGKLESLKALKSIEEYDFTRNLFRTDIPLNENQKNLRIIRFGGNYFDGTIPEALTTFTNLEILELFDNRITGNIPSQFGKLTLLQTFDCAGNRFKGNVPSLLPLTKLRRLRLQDNGFRGEVQILNWGIRKWRSNLGTDSISDCALTGLSCPNCTVCCTLNIQQCINTTFIWPTPNSTFPIIKFQSDRKIFSSLNLLFSTLFECITITLVGASLLYGILRFGDKLDTHYELNIEFQSDSVYRFFLSKNYASQAIAWSGVAVQHMILSEFLAQSSWMVPDNGWIYGLYCPKFRVKCIDNKITSLRGYIMVVVIPLCYLSRDIADGWQLMCWGFRVRATKPIFMGFYLMYITIATILVSIRYLYAAAWSNTDMLKDSALMLFLSEVDEKMFYGVQRFRPEWVDYQEEHVKLYVRQTEGQYFTTFGRDLRSTYGYDLLGDMREIIEELDLESNDGNHSNDILRLNEERLNRLKTIENVVKKEMSNHMEKSMDTKRLTNAKRRFSA